MLTSIIPIFGASAVTVKTRPNNTAAYSALSVIGDATNAIWAFNFLDCPAGSSVLLNSVRLLVYRSTIPSGQSTFRLFLYSASPGSALADGAAYNLPSGDRSTFLGCIDIPPAEIGGTDTLYAYNDALSHQIKLAAASSIIYGYLRTTGGFTPAAQTVYSIALDGASL